MSITKIEVNGKEYYIKSVPLSSLVNTYIEATAAHLRIMAFGLKDIILDKVLAYRPPRGEIKFTRLPEVDGFNIPMEPDLQEHYEPETDEARMLRSIHKLPAHLLGESMIKRISFDFPRLSEKYLDMKIKKGLDPRVLIATGEYLHGIVVRKIKKVDAGICYMVTMARRKHSSGLDLSKLASILEFGTSEYEVYAFGNHGKVVTISLPPRKHWQPSIDAIKRVFTRVGVEVRGAVLKQEIKEIK